MKATVENRSTQNNAVREDYLTPEVNIFETRDGYVLELDMPGVNKDGLEVTVENNQLAITSPRELSSRLRTGSGHRHHEGLGEDRTRCVDADASEVRTCEAAENFCGVSSGQVAIHTKQKENPATQFRVAGLLLTLTSIGRRA
jgi:hypothetical protein